MKITAHFGRKVGLPGYCSVSADCTVEIDAGKTTDPAKLHEHIVAAYSIATAAVEEHLRQQVDLATSGDGRGDGPDGGHELPDRHPVDGPELGPLPRRAGPARAEGYDGPQLDHPQDGRQLLAVLRKMEAAPGASGLPDLNDLVRWGRAQGYGWKVVEWGDAQARSAYEWLLERQAETNRPVRGGATNARNWESAGRTTGRRVTR